MLASSVGDPWHFGADPDPTPDPTPFFIDFKDAKRKSYFFLITCPQAHHLQSKKFNFLLTCSLKMLFCRHYFSPLNTFMRKGKDPEPDPCIWIMDPEGPKTCGPNPDPQHCWQDSFDDCRVPYVLCLRDLKNWRHFVFVALKGWELTLVML